MWRCAWAVSSSLQADKADPVRQEFQGSRQGAKPERGAGTPHGHQLLTVMVAFYLNILEFQITSFINKNSQIRSNDGETCPRGLLTP